jgi:thioredoxin 1
MPVSATKHFTTKPPGGATTEEDPMAHERTSDGVVSSAAIRTVTSTSFDRQVLEATGPVVVEFMSYGCVHCRAIEPVLQQVAEMVKSKEEIFRVNTAVEQDLSNCYQVQGTPTLIMFLHGREVGRCEGPPPSLETILAAVTRPFEG